MMSAPGTWQCLEGPKFSYPWCGLAMFGSGHLVQIKNTFIHVDESAHESADGEEDKPKKSTSCPDLLRDPEDTEARCLLGLGRHNCLLSVDHMFCISAGLAYITLTGRYCFLSPGCLDEVK